jgi:flagellar assembly protein FliH
MFDVDFGPPVVRAHAVAAAVEEEYEAEPPPPPPPTFSEEELQLARDSAYAQGHDAGLAEATEATQRLEANALDAIARHVGNLFAAQAEAADANQRVAVRVAQAVLKRVLPAACEENAFGEVTRTVEECLAQVLDEPRIIVRVAAALVDPVRDRLETVALSHGFEGRVVVQPDARVGMGDCRVEWNDGGAERDQARLLRDIDETIERSLAPPEHRGGA